MLKTGDWIIPVIHGKAYIVKPPLMNWLIAASGSLFGVVSEMTSRLPSVVAMGMTAIAIYFLAGGWMGREARFFASIATLSMTGIIKKGSTAEIDSLFIFFVVTALLFWIHGYEKKWRPIVVWSIPLFISGIGFLTKGPHCAAYFYITVFIYLALRKNLSFFFTRAHIIGILFFFLVPGIYLSFILQRIPADEYAKMWLGEVTSKTGQKSFLAFVKHIFTFPGDVALSFMPWILFLIPAVVMKDLRGKIKGIFRNEILGFSLVMVAVNFPIYWILPEARVRYFLPAGPFVALIMAGFFELYLNSTEENYKIHRIFKNSLKFISWAALLATFCIPPFMLFMNLRIAPPVILLELFLVSIAILCISKIHSMQLKILPVCIALFIGFSWLFYTNFSVQHESKKEYYPQKIASEMNILLPEDVHAVYELGFSRFLDVTGYLKKDVIQLSSFSQLQSIDSKKNAVYFIFDTEFLKTISSDDKKLFYQGMHWEKIYVQKLGKGSGEIVLGHLTNMGSK